VNFKVGRDIVVEGLTKSFSKGVYGVKNLNFKIKEGEFFVVVGPSGSGKTTFLRLIAGLERPTSGKILFGDEDITHKNPRERKVAIVFQEYAIYPHLSVYENIAFPLRIRKYSKDYIDRKVREVAKILEIENLLFRKPDTLSGGQRQRVALGRAIVKDAEIFLFDEPLSNLDAKLRISMRIELKELHKRIKKTFIYVTHDQSEAMSMADTICVLKDGEVVQFGRPDEIYNRPKNLFTAKFFGVPQMNILKGKVKNRDGEIYFDEGSGSLLIDGKFKKYENEEILLGIRPEHIYDRLYTSRPEKGTTLIATFEMMEILGKDFYLYLNTGYHNIVVRTTYKSEIKPGQDIMIVFDMKKAHFFNIKTGERID